MVKEINREQVIQLMRDTLELPPSNNEVIDDTLLASSIRRASSFLCPCSQATIVSHLVQSLRNLVDSSELLESRIEDAINRLIVGGDLLELSDVSTSDVNAKGTWVFPGTPSFILRPNGNVFICGVVGDENLAIPSFSSRIIYRGFKRIVRPESEEKIDEVLKGLGLVSISEKAWLKLPKKVAAEKYLSEMISRFPDDIIEKIEEVDIINYSHPWNYYRKRWSKPKDETGLFVGRRPYLFGAPTWCFVELVCGEVKRLIDVPLSINGIQQRGCDTAWHLLTALDHHNKNHHFYRVRESGEEKILDFFSPIPLWAERRLMAIGDSTTPLNSLFSYIIPKEEFLTEESFLKEYLWMEPHY